MKKLNMKTVGAVALGVGIVAGTVFGAVAFPVQKTVTEQVFVPQEVVKYVNVTKEVPVEVIKNVTVEKIVEVDNGDMAFVLDRLEDKMVISDAETIVEELKAEDSAMKLAFKQINDSDFEYYIYKNGIVNHNHDFKVVKVFTDFEDVNIVKSDFDDNSYKFKFEAKIKDLVTDNYKHVQLTVKVNEGSAKLVKVVEL